MIVSHRTREAPDGTALRILQVTSARTLGGGERHVVELAERLASRGHDVHLALAHGSPLREELRVIPASNLHELRLRNALDLKSATGLAKILREREIQIVHAHVARDYPLAALASRLAPAARLVITRHVMFPLGRAHRLTLSGVSRVIAVSEAVAQSLRRQDIFPAHKIRVVLNGIDLGRVEEVARHFERDSYRRLLGIRAPLAIGIVGELSEVKGHEDFVRAASIIAGENAEVEFLIVGENASRGARYRNKIESLVAKFGLGERVRLLGYRKDLTEVLLSLDLLVSASLSESFGLAIAEAMSCGLPIVATATEGARELISDGETGRVVPIGAPAAIASAVLELLRDSRRRSSLAERARRVAHEKFGLERMVEETEGVYAETLEEATRRKTR